MLAVLVFAIKVGEMFLFWAFSAKSLERTRVSDCGSSYWYGSATTCSLAVIAALLVGVPLYAQEEHAESQSDEEHAESVDELFESPEAAERAHSSRTHRRSPNDAPEQLIRLSQERDALIEAAPLEPLLRAWDGLNDDMEDRIGLRLGMTYTALYQQATASIGSDNAGSGVFELFGNWHLVGTRGDTDGNLVFTLEAAHKYTNIAPDELGESIGSINKTVNEFGNEGLGFTDLYWLQHLADDRLSLRVGKIDQTDVFNAGSFTSDKLFFLGEPFSGNPALPFPEQGLGFAADFTPDGHIYVGVGGSTAVGDRHGSSLDQLDSGEFFAIFEGGYAPIIEGHGRGNYSASIWTIDERVHEGLPSGRGFSLNLDQRIHESYGAFMRYGLADGGGVETRQYVSGGALATRPFDRHHDSTGVAISWSQPAEHHLRDQWNGEVYYRLQLTATTQLTPSVQLIIDPSHNTAEDTIAVFSIRARFEF